MEGSFAKQCICGAVTVFTEDSNNFSMPKKLFKEHFPDLKLEKGKYSNCNYCVNHWGIDLCGCGSGEKVGKCTNDYSACKSHTPAQVLGEAKGRPQWV